MNIAPIEKTSLETINKGVEILQEIIDSHEPKIREITENAGSKELTKQLDSGQCLRVIGDIKEIKRLVEEDFKGPKSEALKAHRWWTTHEKMFLDKLKILTENIEARQGEIFQEQRRKQLEEQKRIDAERRKKEAEAEKERLEAERKVREAEEKLQKEREAREALEKKNKEQVDFVSEMQRRQAEKEELERLKKLQDEAEKKILEEKQLQQMPTETADTAEAKIVSEGVTMQMEEYLDVDVVSLPQLIMEIARGTLSHEVRTGRTSRELLKPNLTAIIQELSVNSQRLGIEWKPGNTYRLAGCKIEVKERPFNRARPKK